MYIRIFSRIRLRKLRFKSVLSSLLSVKSNASIDIFGHLPTLKVLDFLFTSLILDSPVSFKRGDIQKFSLSIFLQINQVQKNLSPQKLKITKILFQEIYYTTSFQSRLSWTTAIKK